MDRCDSKESTAKWTSQVVNAVLAGKLEPVFVEHMEELLQWLAHAKTPDIKAISAEFRKHDVDGEEARQRAFVLLDRALFETSGVRDPNRVLGITQGASGDDIRARYHRLMQIYHPDRNQGNSEWFNNRTERLNWAYSHLKKKAGQLGSTPTQAEKPRPSMGQVRSTQTYGTGYRGVYSDKGAELRKYLGSKAQFQIRFFIGLIIIAMGLLGYLYFKNV